MCLLHLPTTTDSRRTSVPQVRLSQPRLEQQRVPLPACEAAATVVGCERRRQCCKPRVLPHALLHAAAGQQGSRAAEPQAAPLPAPAHLLTISPSNRSGSLYAAG